MSTLSLLKVRTVLVVFALAVATASPTLSAQMPSPRTAVNVPFAFEVGTAHFAAGKYILSSRRDELLVIQGATRSALAISSYEPNVTPSGASEVTFHRYGNRYFLREIWMKGKSEHLLCPESKAEGRVKRDFRLYDRASVVTPTSVDVAVIGSPR